jgi:hypothetical protein
MSNFNRYNKQMTDAEMTTMEVFKMKGRGEGRDFDYPEPVAGKYVATIDKMALVEDRNQLKFKMTFKLLEGADADTQEYMESWPGKGNPKIPFSRPISNTRNDAACVGSVIGLVSKFCEEIPVTFNSNYDELADTIQKVFEESKAKNFVYLISYNKDEFIRFIVEAILTEAEDEDSTSEPIQGNPDDAAVEAVTGEERPANGNVITRSMQMPTSMPQPEKEIDGLAGFIPIEDDDEDDLPF